MMSAFEMNQNLDFVEEEIRSVPEYVEEFKKVFGDGDVTRQRIAMAIAAFERTIISRDAPLDRFLLGDKKALSPDARKGYDIFIGKGKCAECHDGVNLADDKFYALNVPENPEHLMDPRIAATRRFRRESLSLRRLPDASGGPRAVSHHQGPEGLEGIPDTDPPRDRPDRAVHAQRDPADPG